MEERSSLVERIAAFGGAERSVNGAWGKVIFPASLWCQPCWLLMVEIPHTEKKPSGFTLTHLKTHHPLKTPKLNPTSVSCFTNNENVFHYGCFWNFKPTNLQIFAYLLDVDLSGSANFNKLKPVKTPKHIKLGFLQKNGFNHPISTKNLIKPVGLGILKSNPLMVVCVNWRQISTNALVPERRVAMAVVQTRWVHSPANVRLDTCYLMTDVTVEVTLLQQ